MSGRQRQTGLELRHKLRLWSAGLAVVAVLAAAFGVPPAISPVSDLKLLRVDFVEPAQIPRQDKFWDYKKPLIRVEFSSQADLQNLANTRVYAISNQVSICSDKSIDDKRLIEGYPHVFDQIASVYTYDKRKTSRASHDTSAPIIYHIYIDPRQTKVADWYHYDLIRDPADVCFEVGGFGERLPISFWSNTVVIPKQMIEDAFKRAGVK